MSGLAVDANLEHSLPPDWERFYLHLRQPGYIPGYEIQGLLGHGSFGVVYKARKISVGRPCALKFLKVDDPATGQAVLRELASLEHLAQLDHPGLVSVEDRGVVDGIPYIVMGYGGDETLATRLSAGGPLAADRAADLLARLCAAVQALHDHGVVHFDIKPANIFLRGDRPRLGDYGLARLITQSRKTLSMGRGTPLYMAPELLAGKGDERADIYSLGVVLYECLAGVPPFQGENEWEVLRRHESEPVRFPKTFPPRFRAVVERALAKDPRARYRSAAELGRDLAAGTAAPPAPQRPATVPRVPPRGSRPRRVLAGIDWFLGLPGRLLGMVFRLVFRLFGFAIELFLLVFIIFLAVRILGPLLGGLVRGLRW